jgi:acyl-CoA synthetase (AMP-forming)/AMP-acid ligase II
MKPFMDEQANCRLEWSESDQSLGADSYRRIFGPGAQFELCREEVADRPPVQVYAQRPHELGELLELASPEERFLVFPDIELTYGQALERIGGVAAALKEHDVRPGTRVAIASANSLEYVLTYWAVVAIGAVVVGLNGWWAPSELEHGVQLTDPILVLADEPRLTRLRQAGVGAEPLSDFVDAAPRSGSLPARLSAEDDPAIIMFTSGTTGRAKGATLSHRNLLHATQSAALRSALGAAQSGLDPLEVQGSVVMIIGPLFHISGTISLFGAPWRSSTLLFPPPGRWDERRHLEMTEHYAVQAWSAVPTHYWRILDHPDFERRNLSSLRMASSGGSVFPPALMHVFQQRLPNVTLSNGYGMTETCGVGTIASGQLLLAHPECVGRPWPTAEVEIRGTDGEALGAGEVGEIAIRTASVFLGYWNDRVATQAAIDREGWYHTGDFGAIRDGTLQLESRMRDLVIRGGENIYPPEIENRLIEHEDVVDCAVIGVPHHLLGQEVKAFVVRRDGSNPSIEDLRRWVGDALAPFKVPALIEFRPSLPYTETGKVIKHALE